MSSSFQVTSIFKEHGVGNMTVQIEKEYFYHNLNKLSGNSIENIEFPKQRTTKRYESINIVKAV